MGLICCLNLYLSFPSLSDRTSQTTECDTKIIQEIIHHRWGEGVTTQKLVFVVHTSILHVFSLPAVTFIIWKKCTAVVGFTRILKAFIRESLWGGESRKDKGQQDFSGVWDRLSDNTGLKPDYCFTFSRGEILHWGWVLTVTPKPLLSTARQQCRTGRDYSGFPELLKIQGEWQVK